MPLKIFGSTKLVTRGRNKTAKIGLIEDNREGGIVNLKRGQEVTKVIEERARVLKIDKY